MTRRTISTMLASALVGLLALVLPSPAVRAYEPCDGQADNRCTATNATVDDTATLHAQAVLSPAQTTAPRAIYRVGDSVYYISLAGDRWAIYDRQPDGILVSEGYQSGPPPTDGVALNP